jgi:hypothetical protein
MLLATIRGTPQDKSPECTMLDVIPVGPRLRLKAPRTGTLYFRINDFWNELADNSGTLSITVRGANGQEETPY